MTQSTADDVKETQDTEHVFEEYAQYYDVFYAGKDYSAECDFIENAFTKFGLSKNQQKPLEILDLACGTGNHGLRLAARGHQLCGVDRSTVMLDQHRHKASQQNLPVDLHEQDLRSFDLGRQFDAAICMFDAIDYVTDNGELREFLQRVRAHLRPNGLFVFDFWHATPILRSHDPVRVREYSLDDKRITRISSTKLNVAHQTADVEFRVLVMNNENHVTESRETHVMRYFLPQEMAFILEATGWHLLHLCPAFVMEGTIDADSWHLVAIATPEATSN